MSPHMFNMYQQPCFPTWAATPGQHLRSVFKMNKRQSEVPEDRCVFPNDTSPPYGWLLVKKHCLTLLSLNVNVNVNVIVLN